MLTRQQPKARVDSAHVTLRVPKLAVRNRTSDDSNAIEPPATATSDAVSENDGSGPASSNSSQRVRTPMSARSISDESVQRPCSSDKRQSGESSKAAVTAAATKKKRGGVLNFLALKEPSTSAWAEFAEAEKEKARQKGLSSPLASPRRVPPQKKLPDYVPKVNSKWDGLPDNARRKSIDSKAASRANRNSMMSTATKDTTWTATSTVSGDSKTTKKAVATLSGRPVRDSMQSNVRSVRSSSSRGSGRQPPALALEKAVETTEENLPQTFLRDPSPPPQQYLPELDGTTPLSPPELEGDDMHYFLELDASPPHSPRTPPADGSEARPALVGIHYPELDSLQKEVELDSATEQDSVVRANSSRRPINFSRPQVKKGPASPTLAIQTEDRDNRSPSPASMHLSPTLTNRAGKIDPFLTDTFASHSRETGHIPKRVASTLHQEISGPKADTEAEGESPPISPLEPDQSFFPSGFPDINMRPPTAGSTETTIPAREGSAMENQSQLSLTPSEFSAQWQMSPKERLGLGSRIRKSEVLPWESSEVVVEDASSVRRDRLSPSPGPEGSRMKRLSWRLSARSK